MNRVKAKKEFPPQGTTCVQFSLADKRIRVKPKSTTMLFEILNKKTGVSMNLTDNELFQILEFVQSQYPDVMKRHRPQVCPGCPNNYKNVGWDG